MDAPRTRSEYTFLWYLAYSAVLAFEPLFRGISKLWRQSIGGWLTPCLTIYFQRNVRVQAILFLRNSVRGVIAK